MPRIGNLMFIHFHIVCVCVVLLCIDLHRFPIIKPRNFSFVFFSLSSRPLLLSFIYVHNYYFNCFFFLSLRNSFFIPLDILMLVFVVYWVSFLSSYNLVSFLSFEPFFSVPFAKSFAYNVRLVFVLFRLNIPLIYSVECSKPYW